MMELRLPLEIFPWELTPGGDGKNLQMILKMPQHIFHLPTKQMTYKTSQPLSRLT